MSLERTFKAVLFLLHWYRYLPPTPTIHKTIHGINVAQSRANEESISQYLKPFRGEYDKGHQAISTPTPPNNPDLLQLKKLTGNNYQNIKQKIPSKMPHPHNKAS